MFRTDAAVSLNETPVAVCPETRVSVAGVPFHWHGIAGDLYAESVLARGEALDLKCAIAARFGIFAERRQPALNRHDERGRNGLPGFSVLEGAGDTGRACLADGSRD